MACGVQPLYLDCDRAQVITCWAGIAVYTAMTLWFIAWVVTNFGQVGAWPWVLALLPTTLLALFLADLMSGVVHWGTDTWFNEVMSERVIDPLRKCIPAIREPLV